MVTIHSKIAGLFLVACFVWGATAMAGLQKDIQQETDNNPFFKEQGLSVRVSETNGYVTLEVTEGNREVREIIYEGVDISSITGSAITMDMLDLDKSACETLSALNRTIKRIEKMEGVKEVAVKALINTEKDRLAAPGPNAERQTQGSDAAWGQKNEVREKPLAVANNYQGLTTFEGIWKGSSRGSDGLFKKADYEHEITISKQQPFVWVRTGGSTKYAKWVYAVVSSDVNQVSAVYDEGTVRSKVVFSMAPGDPNRAKLVEELYRLRTGDHPMYIREDVYQLQRAP